MIDATLDERLREGVCDMLVAYPVSPDWDGVLRAATRPADVRRRKGRRAPRLGRSVLIAVALVLLGGSIAFALADRIVEVMTGGPAPPTVQTWMKTLDGRLGPAGIGKIVPGSAHLAISLSTKRFGVVQLYSARTSRGLCEVIVRDGRQSGQCSVDRKATGSPVVFGFGGTPDKPGWNLVDGRTALPAGRVLRIRFRRGPSRTVTVHDRFFLFELGPDHSQRSSNPPVAFDVLDASGHTLGTRQDPLRVEGRSLLGTSAVPASIHTIATARLPRGHRHVTIQGGRDVRGRPCFRAIESPDLRLPKGVRVLVRPPWTCNASVGRYGHESDPRRPTSLRRVPISWMRSGTYAAGWVAPRITRLAVHFQNGSTATVRLHHGYFVYAIPARNWRPGNLPNELRAFGDGGKLAYRQALPPVQVCASGECTSTSGTGGSTGFVGGLALSP